jgi:formamidopyrimidine-DNA glycosylase
MPELAEVERGRKLAETVARGRGIARVRCADDEIVFEGRRPAALRRALKGARVERVERKGKYLFFALDRRPWPIFHFGMTGSFRTPDDEPLRLQAHGRELDRTWPPRFTKIHLELDDGGELVMTNARRLGRVLLRADPLAEPPMSRLGFDPLLAMPTPARFEALVRPRRVTLKGLLLDQGFAAGVGNWIADEVLYQAALDPRRKANSLSSAEIRRMRQRLGHIVRAAVRVDADKTRFPRAWLFHHRWDRKKGAQTAKGERIEHLTLAGRTTAWVPTVQS